MEENFICKYFLDSREFDLKKRPGEFIEGIKSEEDNLPDCKFMDKRSGKIFWVECKWRPKWNKENEVEKTFFKTNKIEYYKKAQERTKYKVFIALGIGCDEEENDTLKPEELYFFPINMFNTRYKYIRKEYLIDNNTLHNFKYKKPKFFPDNDNLK